MIAVFLDTSLVTIVVILCVLCAQLIYSLMLSDVEERTFEFGMLRALGFNTKNVIGTVFLQAMLFATPGLLFGLVAAAILNTIFRAVLYHFTLPSTYEVSTGALILGCSIGIVLPIISNLFPIQRALEKNLRSSLDMYRRTSGEITIKVLKL